MNFNKYGRTAQLFDYQTMSDGLVGSFLNSDGTITTNAASSSWTITKYIPVAGREFTLQRQASGGATSICLYDSNQTYITGLAYNGNGTVTVSANTDVSYIRFTYYRTENTGNIMLNEGSTAKPFEPYGNTWTDIPHYIHNTSTDTITTLPTIIYPNDTTATVSISGNMEQNGTPSPRNPIQPSECGNMSSNLFDFTAYYAKDSGVSNIVTTQNSITYNVSSTYCAIRYKFSIAQNETMKLSLGSATGNGRLEIRYYNTQAGQQVGNTLTVMQNERITLTGSSEYDSVNIYISNGTTIGTMSFSDIMINIGTTFLPFEPYGQYKIPISSAGQTTPVYLGEVQTTRRIKKLVLTGTENWFYRQGEPPNIFFLEFLDLEVVDNLGLCTHYLNQDSGSFDTLADKHILARFASDGTKSFIAIRDSSFTIINGFKSYLAQQYAAGTPVTIWYVLAEPETGIVNEPIRKIGDYADTVSGIAIPTIAGKDTFDVETTLKPSEVTVNYKGWHPVADVHERENGAWT